jgi:peroxiredoxin
MRKQLFIALAGWMLFAQAAEFPDCKLISPAGEEHRLHQLQTGKVVYLDFWASWCPTCARSFKFLNALAEDLGKRGLLVLAVNLDEEPEGARSFLEQYPVRFTVLYDPHGDCARAFAVAGMPATYVIDRQGKVRYRQVGFRSEEANALKARVEELVAEP